MEKLVSTLQLLYKSNRKISVSAGPLSRAVKDEPHVPKLKLQATMQEIKHLAAVAAVASSKQKSDAPKIRNVGIVFEVTRLLMETDDVKQLRAEVAILGRVVEKTTA